MDCLLERLDLHRGISLRRLLEPEPEGQPQWGVYPWRLRSNAWLVRTGMAKYFRFPGYR